MPDGQCRDLGTCSTGVLPEQEDRKETVEGEVLKAEEESFPEALDVKRIVLCPWILLENSTGAAQYIWKQKGGRQHVQSETMVA